MPLTMGFKKVYNVLLEIFPEVDNRALRAVAIEHQKDGDAAVEVVLTEIIPFLTERSMIKSSSCGENKSSSCCENKSSSCCENKSLSCCENRAIAQPPKATEVYANGPFSSNDVPVGNVECQEEEQHGPFYDAKTEHDQTFHDANDGLHQVYLDGPDKLASVNECGDKNVTFGAGADVTSCVSSAVLIHEHAANIDTDKVCDHTSNETPSEASQQSSIIFGCDQVFQPPLKPLENVDLDASQSSDYSVESKSTHAKKFENNFFVENFVGYLSPSHSEPFTPLDIGNSDLEMELDGPNDASLNTDASNEMVDVGVEDDSVLNTVVTQSGQVYSIDLLEDIIADSRNNKKTLLSAVEIILGLMKEVEIQEKAAKQAKEDAANGGLDILTRVEDLKQMLQHAKEANDMHAGEVYGEKAILATEVRELQARLLCLSDERDKSLGILDEMRQSLEVRLAVAEKERELAEKEKLERDDMAQKALKYQEVIMEKVVQEANVLKQEAEANSKLREFLMDRGRVVDTLQGEISVLCTDIRLLKEKFDERLPLSKSLTSSQTSCILASSSSSSSKSTMTSERVDQVANLTDPFENCEKIDDEFYFDEPKCMGVETAADDHKDLADEGWEIFEYA